MDIQFTTHSVQRSAQRGLTAPQIMYVLLHGQRFHRAGAMIYYLRRRDVPACDRKNDVWMHLAGTAVVLATDGCTVITVWRNQKNGLQRIRRKPEHRGNVCHEELSGDGYFEDPGDMPIPDGSWVQSITTCAWQKLA